MTQPGAPPLLSANHRGEYDSTQWAAGFKELRPGDPYVRLRNYEGAVSVAPLQLINAGIAHVLGKENAATSFKFGQMESRSSINNGQRI